MCVCACVRVGRSYAVTSVDASDSHSKMEVCSFCGLGYEECKGESECVHDPPCEWGGLNYLMSLPRPFLFTISSSASFTSVAVLASSSALSCLCA